MTRRLHKKDSSFSHYFKCVDEIRVLICICVCIFTYKSQKESKEWMKSINQHKKRESSIGVQWVSLDMIADLNSIIAYWLSIIRKKWSIKKWQLIEWAWKRRVWICDSSWTRSKELTGLMGWEEIISLNRTNIVTVYFKTIVHLVNNV